MGSSLSSEAKGRRWFEVELGDEEKHVGVRTRRRCARGKLVVGECETLEVVNAGVGVPAGEICR